MVDVAEKRESQRIALAVSTVKISDEILAQIESNALKKGDVSAVARLAGIMAAKQTASLIPLCHTITLANVQIKLLLDKPSKCVQIFCRAKTNAQTGVEMEALVGASLASLALYDMCKAVSHEMVISETRLLGKSGGKRDFGRVEMDALTNWKDLVEL